MRTFLTFLSLVAMAITANDPKMRKSIDYNRMFSETSDITAVIVSCANVGRLKTTIHSFLAFNTEPLMQLIVVHCYRIDMK